MAQTIAGFFYVDRMRCPLCSAMQLEADLRRTPVERQRRVRRRRTAHDLAAPDHGEPRRAQTDRFDRIACVEQYEIRVAARRDAIAFEAENARRVDRDRVEAGAHAGLARH